VYCESLHTAVICVEAHEASAPAQQTSNPTSNNRWLFRRDLIAASLENLDWENSAGAPR
jgi:hypothetical protein